MHLIDMKFETHSNDACYQLETVYLVEALIIQEKHIIGIGQ